MKKLYLNKMSSKSKIFAIFSIFSILLISSFIFIDMKFFSENLKKTIHENMEKKLFEKEDYLKEIFINSENILQSIRNSELFLNYLENPKTNEKIVKNLFLTISRNDLNIMQMRYISENGLEKIRIDRENIGSDPFVILDTFLQNKASRYYFSDSIKREYEKVWFSNVDLNIEKGKVQIPFNSTLRAILPIEKEGKFYGIIIINYFMEKLLSNLIKESLYDMVLINEKNEVLQHYNKNYNWSYYTKRTFDLKEEYPKFYKNILEDSYLSNNQLVFKDIDIPTLEKLKLIVQVNNKYVEIEKKEKLKQYIIEGVIVLVLFILMSYIFSKILNRLTLKLENSKKYNLILNDEIESRTKELQEKEELMLIQSRHAAMGEMISMIAHQWRQPITVISMAANNILVSIELDEEINSKELAKVAKNITKQTNYLSQTIEDFRNFFKPNDIKELSKISTVFEELKVMMGSSLKNNDIEMIEEYKSDIGIAINRKELLQVLLNIIKNAQEAFKESATVNKRIKVLEYEKQDSLIIEVIDNAGGIEENIINKIFDPYFSTKSQLVGTGLGLYMSKIIIEKHLNGSIEAYNKDDGACFKIILLKNK